MVLLLQYGEIEPKSYDVRMLFSAADGQITESGLMAAAFRGHQKFFVNGDDFSHYLPLMFFSHQVSEACEKLDAGETRARIWDVDSVWALNFIRKGVCFQVEAEAYGHKESLKWSTECPLAELKEASKIYAKELYAHCCKLCPQIENDSFVKEWMYL